MFSSRLPAALAPNAITRAAQAARARGVRLLDLTESNPTRVGVQYPASLLASLADPSSLTYAPEPFGLRSAREAVASHVGGSAGADIDPGRVILSASTSEAYGWLFKLLCDPGDDVLVPAPSYPLFEALASLDAVRLAPYRLDYHGLWSIDRDSLSRALSPRTRAVLVVSPNNPTGSCLRGADRDWLLDLAVARGLAVIADEVFSEYPLRPGPDAVSLLGPSPALTFVLGGLSKSAGLPQLKLAWTIAGGPAPLCDDALARLEVIADTYLSVSTPVQLATPDLIHASRAIRAQIQARIDLNLSTLEALAGSESPVTLVRPEGGWSAVLRVPAIESEESIVLRLLDEASVLVHPGYFFDFESEAWLVLSLLPEPGVFTDAVRRLLARVAVTSTR